MNLLLLVFLKIFFMQGNVGGEEKLGYLWLLPLENSIRTLQKESYWVEFSVKTFMFSMRT
jgi:hypothetical protein